MIPKNNCCSTIVFPDFGAGSNPLPIPIATAWRIRYSIGSTLITSFIGFTSADNPLTVASIQAKIDANATYQASGTTITVNSLDSNGLSVTICKPSKSQIKDNAEGVFDLEES